MSEHPKPSLIVLRVTRERKAAYVRAAAGRPLASWIFALCDRAADFTEKPKDKQ